MPAEPTRQGEIWTAASRLSGRRTTVVVCDADIVVTNRQNIVVAPLREAREVPVRHQLLTVPFGDTHVIALYDLAVINKDTCVDYTTLLGSDVLDQVKVGLRARFDL